MFLKLEWRWKWEYGKTKKKDNNHMVPFRKYKAYLLSQSDIVFVNLLDTYQQNTQRDWDFSYRTERFVLYCYLVTSRFDRGLDKKNTEKDGIVFFVNSNFSFFFKFFLRVFRFLLHFLLFRLNKKYCNHFKKKKQEKHVCCELNGTDAVVIRKSNLYSECRATCCVSVYTRA